MDIGIETKNRKAVADSLQLLLADEFVLYTKTRNYHWNIKATNFLELHEFYEEQYNDLAIKMDEVAERIRTLGHLSIGTLDDFLTHTQLTESEYTTDAEKQLQNLINDHESIIKYLRKCAINFDEKYNDLGSSDFVIALIEKHEKMRWMLNSFLVEKKRSIEQSH